MERNSGNGERLRERRGRLERARFTLSIHLSIYQSIYLESGFRILVSSVPSRGERDMDKACTYSICSNSQAQDPNGAEHSNRHRRSGVWEASKKETPPSSRGPSSQDHSAGQIAESEMVFLFMGVGGADLARGRLEAVRRETEIPHTALLRLAIYLTPEEGPRSGSAVSKLYMFGKGVR